MPRVAGVDIPNDKPTLYSLQYIYGIGPKIALDVLKEAQIEVGRGAMPVPAIGPATRPSGGAAFADIQDISDASSRAGCGRWR